MRISRKKTKALITCLIAVVLIGFLIWDILYPPLWFQFEAQENKKVIMEYAREHFPDAIVVKENYGSTVPFVTANKLDYIVFEQDGVTFSIWANDGELWGENYLSSKGIQYIKREIIEKFLKPRNINAKYSVHFDGPDPIDSIENYIGCIDIYINDSSYCSSDTPIDAGWFYDFYIYLQKKSNLKNYRVFIQLDVNGKRQYKLNFTQDSEFENANKFYAAFQCKELN